MIRVNQFRILVYLSHFRYHKCIMSDLASNAGFSRASWNLLTTLVVRNLKIRYKGSVLGFFWSLLTPALTILMYAIFAHILKFNNGQPRYLEFLVAGIIVWTFTVGTLNDSLFAIIGNANLVKKVYFPRSILPLSTALANCVNMLLTCIPLLIYLWATGALEFSVNIAWIVPALFFHTVLCVGIAYIVSTLNVFFRDTQHIIGVGQLAWFFLTPVFYNLSMQLNSLSFLPSQFKGIAFLNPMTGVLSMYRRGLMGTDFIPADYAMDVSPWWVALSACVCVLTLLVGWLILRQGDRKFGDVL